MTAARAALASLARRVRVAAFDVDGVLTDGGILLGPDGAEYKQFNVRDGHGLTMLREAGIDVAIITGRNSQVVAHRMSELGVRYLYQGRRDKLAALTELCATAGIEPAEVCYLGDDLPDVPVMNAVGLPVAVADAHPAVMAAARCRTQAVGGRGAAREVAEFILDVQGRLTFDGADLLPLGADPAA